MESTKKSRSFWNALLIWGLHACRASDRQLSRLMGRSEDYVGYSRRNRKKGPTLDDAFRLIEAIGLPDWVVFGKLFPPPSRPAELLERLWRHAGKSGDPAPLFFPAAEAALAALDSREIGMLEPPRWPLRLRFLRLARLRRDSPELAIGRLESEIEALLAACRSAPRADPGALGDLAHALAIWGDTRRSSGDLGAAFRACHLSLDLAERSADRWVLGQSLFMAALLLADLGFAEYGLPWLERAAGLVALERRPEDLPELLAAQGLLLLDLGRQEPGLRCLRQAIDLLPGGERRWRHAALHQLAAAAQDAGNPREALNWLELLAREQEGPSCVHAVIEWRQADALLVLGEKQKASETYLRALAQLGSLGDPADAVALLCAAGERLLDQGEIVAAGRLAGELLGAFAGKMPSRLAEIAEDLHALGRLRPLAATDFRLARHRLEALQRRAGELRLPKP